MKEETKRWIEAGKILSINPKARVLCPKCQSESLDVKDIEFEKIPNMFERQMICPKCGANNLLRKEKEK